MTSGKKEKRFITHDWGLFSFTDDKINVKEIDGKWYVEDIHEVLVPSNNESYPYRKKTERYWREVEKPHIHSLLRSYRIFRQPHGWVCHECNKHRADGEHWSELCKIIREHPNQGYFKDGDAFFYPTTQTLPFPDGYRSPIPEDQLKEIVWTNKSFKHRDYCSDECFNNSKTKKKRAREDRRRERREKERNNRYAKLPDQKRPDGYCKICNQIITDQRAGTLICKNHSPGERRKYYRQKKKVKGPVSF